MVTVKLFGTLRVDSGVKSFTAEAASVRDLYPLVVSEIHARRPDFPVSEASLRACLIAVNGAQASPRTRLHEGDTVCFFPAVAGG